MSVLVQLLEVALPFPGAGDARRVMQQGGLEIDGRKVTDFAETVTPCTGMKLRRGKNRLARLRVIS